MPPVVGGPCPGNPGHHDGVWTSVTALADGEGGLHVNYVDQKVLLTPGRAAPSSAADKLVDSSGEQRWLLPVFV